MSISVRLVMLPLPGPPGRAPPRLPHAGPPQPLHGLRRARRSPWTSSPVALTIVITIIIVVTSITTMYYYPSRTPEASGFCQRTLEVPESPFPTHLLVSVLVLSLEVCFAQGNPELAAPSPKKKY